MTSIDTYLGNARSLAEVVDCESDRIERERRIPAEIVDQLIDQGFFRLLLPRSLGGAELDHPDFLKIVGIFAQADASVAWCINQNNVFSTNAVRVSRETADEVWGNARTVVTNGPPTPGSKAVITDGGYRLTGRWRFSSGIFHANWVAALVPVYSTCADEPEEMRTLLLPKSQVDLIDEWQVGGLRGTGSLGFAAEDVFVPRSRSYGLSEPSSDPGSLYVIDTTPMFASGFATVALGAARTAIDSAIELSRGIIQHGAETKLLHDVTTQRMVGEAEGTWNSARAFLDEAVLGMWDSVTTSHELDTGTRIRVRLASTHSIRQAAAATDIAYTLCGSSAIFDANPIQRRFQDVHAITQQIQGRLTHYDTVGQYHLGLDPKGIF